MKTVPLSKTIGPEGLQSAKAWEIHPIKMLAERQWTKICGH
jgi:hypothetical protein